METNLEFIELYESLSKLNESDNMQRAFKIDPNAQVEVQFFPETDLFTTYALAIAQEPNADKRAEIAQNYINTAENTIKEISYPELTKILKNLSSTDKKTLQNLYMLNYSIPPIATAKKDTYWVDRLKIFCNNYLRENALSKTKDLVTEGGNYIGTLKINTSAIDNTNHDKLVMGHGIATADFILITANNTTKKIDLKFGIKKSLIDNIDYYADSKTKWDAKGLIIFMPDDGFYLVNIDKHDKEKYKKFVKLANIDIPEVLKLKF